MCIRDRYYASTVDNARYGCGDKVLHNIVGGHLGVLEGNGGDLRIGLSLQSLHDGEQWVHAPLRLQGADGGHAALILPWASGGYLRARMEMSRSSTLTAPSRVQLRARLERTPHLP